MDYADNRVIARGGSKGATMSLKQKQWLGYTPSDGKVKIGTVTGNYPTQADTVTDNELSGLITDKYSAKLQFKGVSAIEIENNTATVGIQDGALLKIDKTEANLSAKTVRISNTTGTKHKITVSESGIVLSGLNVNGSTLLSNKHLKIQGKLIKIG